MLAETALTGRQRYDWRLLLPLLHSLVDAVLADYTRQQEEEEQVWGWGWRQHQRLRQRLEDSWPALCSCAWVCFYCRLHLLEIGRQAA